MKLLNYMLFSYFFSKIVAYVYFFSFFFAKLLLDRSKCFAQTLNRLISNNFFTCYKKILTSEMKLQGYKYEKILRGLCRLSF